MDLTSIVILAHTRFAARPTSFFIDHFIRCCVSAPASSRRVIVYCIAHASPFVVSFYIIPLRLEIRELETAGHSFRYLPYWRRNEISEICSYINQTKKKKCFLKWLILTAIEHPAQSKGEGTSFAPVHVHLCVYMAKLHIFGGKRRWCRVRPSNALLFEGTRFLIMGKHPIPCSAYSTYACSFV